MFGKLKRYLHNVLVSVDQAANVAAGGKPDETISSRSQRAADRGNIAGKVMTKFLHLFQRDHGRRAQQGDIKRAVDVIVTEEADLNAPTVKR